MSGEHGREQDYQIKKRLLGQVGSGQYLIHWRARRDSNPPTPRSVVISETESQSTIEKKERVFFTSSDLLSILVNAVLQHSGNNVETNFSQVFASQSPLSQIQIFQ